MQQVIDNIYQIQFIPYVNGYVIQHNNTLTVIDTGLSPGSINRLEKGLQKQGKALTDIDVILITYAHPDHVGGLANLQSRCGDVQTIAHRREAAVIRGEKEQALAPKHELKGLAWLIGLVISNKFGDFAHISTEVDEGTQLDHVLPGLQVIELIGHSYGHVGYWWPEKHLLFGGDVLMNLPWGLRMPPRPPSPDWAAAKQSIKKIAGMDIDILCLGHGKPLIGDAHIPIGKFAATL